MAKNSGLTLVELMIAIALMLILTLQLQIVFGQAQKLYLGADALAQVYSNARIALDQMEKDLANAVPTDQMEFFNDLRDRAIGVGHFNPDAGEENASLVGRFVPGVRYIYGMAFKQPKEYMPKDAGKVGGPYRQDSVYFRAFTIVDGRPREALIEYRLFTGLDPQRNPRRRPVLQRIITAPRIDPTTGVPVYDSNGYPVLERLEPQDMCYYVQEFKVDFFLRDRRRRGSVGRFYSPREAIQTNPRPDDPQPPGLGNLFAGSEEVAVQCLDGSPAVDQNARLDRDQSSATFGKLILKNGDRLPRLMPGDGMYLVSKLYPPNYQTDFKAQYLTIKEILTPSATETVVSFEEESMIRQTVGGTGWPVSQLEMSYRGAWLPQAVRVQMKIKDARADEVRTMTRIFQLLRS